MCTVYLRWACQGNILIILRFIMFDLMWSSFKLMCEFIMWDFSSFANLFQSWNFETSNFVVSNICICHSSRVTLIAALGDSLVSVTYCTILPQSERLRFPCKSLSWKANTVCGFRSMSVFLNCRYLIQQLIEWKLEFLADITQVWVVRVAALPSFTASHWGSSSKFLAWWFGSCRNYDWSPHWNGGAF